MPDMTTLPIMTASDAESIGFARFHDVPTLPIDIPDGGFTLSAKTTEGRRLTIYFGPHRTGGPARFVDIQYHDSGMTIANADRGRSPAFDMLTIARGGRQPFDSRKLLPDDKLSIAVILMDNGKADRTTPPATAEERAGAEGAVPPFRRPDHDPHPAQHRHADHRRYLRLGDRDHGSQRRRSTHSAGLARDVAGRCAADRRYLERPRRL